MSNYTAADVKRLRDETDAPMMECKKALEEAGGDFEKAKNLLREAGKAAAAKRSGRATGAGVVAIAASDDGRTVGAVVLESETDFVAKNPDFIQIAQELAEMYRDSDPADNGGASAKAQEVVEGAVAKIRENIKVARAIRLSSEKPLATYVHHDKTKGAIVEIEGEGGDAARKVAIQVVSNPPLVVSKDQLPQDKLAQELDIETKRAMEEGKPENIAKNIAQGRVNKGFVKQAALLEQDFYADTSKTVAQFLSEEAKGAAVRGFTYLAVGQGVEG
jgi:elongation factor Ts